MIRKCNLKVNADTVTPPVQSGACRSRATSAKVRLIALPRIIGGHVLALVDQAVVSAASFLTTVIISRFTDPGQLGIYAIAFSILASVYTIQGQLISLPYSIQRHRQVEAPAEHAGGSLVFAGLLAAAVTMVLAIIALSLIAGGGRGELMAITWALIGVMPFALLRDFFRRFSFAHLQMGNALILDLAVAVIQLLMLGWLGWAGQMSAVTACLAMGASCGIAALGSLYLSRGRFAFDVGQVRTTARQSWNLGKWLVANQIMVQVQRYSAYWLSVMIAGAAATGIFTACMSIVAFTNPLFYGLNNIFTQKSVLAWKEGGAAGLQRQTFHDLLLLGGALAPFCVLALWAGEDVMRFFYSGNEYQGYGQTIAVLAFAILASAVGSPASNALASMERPRTTLVINSIGTVLTVILVGGLTANWGLNGAAYGLLSSNVIVSLGLWIGFLSLILRVRDTAPTLQVLHKLTGTSTSDAGRWAITKIGEGDHSSVYAIQSDDRQRVWGAYFALVIKVYRPEVGLTLGMVNEQFTSLSRLHAALDGSIANGWTVSTPRPLYICDSPLALVMTAVPGNWDLKSGTGLDENLTPELLDSLGRALVTAMGKCWSRGKLHGDLGLQNILYDIQRMQLSFIDSGTRECCIVCNDITNPWSPAALELGHILRDLGTDVRNLAGSPIAWSRRRRFTESALRAFLETFDTLEEKQQALDEIRICAQSHLSKVLEPSWSLRGLCRKPLTRFVEGRMDSILRRLKIELTALKKSLEDTHAASKIKGLDEHRAGLLACGAHEKTRESLPKIEACGRS
jgi:O-antigen/teichoic acid export membrane protein